MPITMREINLNIKLIAIKSFVSTLTETLLYINLYQENSKVAFV
ncbi:MAG: hypothetical protein ACI8SC_001675 [Colwellia sp.]|jgi:hypothetical protein